ncbi:MAG: hypothetical protein E6K18_01080 [Methanobacteriota archaeon]|nr:MAG: hypothetical protein E6K18_01080 [Euryarchaeota archaeon]
MVPSAPARRSSKAVVIRVGAYPAFSTVRLYVPAKTLGNTNVPFSEVSVVWLPRITVAPATAMS